MDINTGKQACLKRLDEFDRIYLVSLPRLLVLRCGNIGRMDDYAVNADLLQCIVS